jgi:hypothetical protein
MVREIDLKIYDERYDELVVRVDGLSSFVMEADSDISDLENRVNEVKRASKRIKRA